MSTFQPIMSQLPPGSHADGSSGKFLIDATRTELPARKNGFRRRSRLGRWLLILLGPALGYLGALYYLSKVPEQYTATLQVLIKPRLALGKSRAQSDASTRQDLNTAVERLRCRELLAKAASRQDVRDFPGLLPRTVVGTPGWLGDRSTQAEIDSPPAISNPPTLAAMISSWLTVSIRPGTSLIDVSITHPVPEIASTLANAIGREYVHENSRTRFKALADELDVAMRICFPARNLSKELDAKEAERVALVRDHPRGHPTLESCEAELKVLRERFQAEFHHILQTRQQNDYWTIIGMDLPSLATSPAEYLRFAQQSLELYFQTLASEMLSQDYPGALRGDARVPQRPSGPDRPRAIVQGTLGGLLLAMLLAGQWKR